MKRFFLAATLAATLGIAAVPCSVSAAPPETMPKVPVKMQFFGVVQNEATATYRKRYQTLRAALPPVTRRTVIALLPGVVDLLRPTQNGYISPDTHEKRLHALIQERFRRTTPVTLDVLTLYALLETNLPDSDFATAFLADFDVNGDWHDNKHQQFIYLNMNMGRMDFGRSPQLITDLMAATSDAPASLLRGIR